VHTLPAALHTGSVLHVHADDPAEPVHVCRVPHATGVAYAQQPLLPNVHVARPPDTHAVWPDAQLLVHVSEHAAPGSFPEHDCGVEHFEVEATYGQPFPSTAQVDSVWPS
jgi:hypothetical protein